MTWFPPLSQSPGSICRAENFSGLQTLPTGPLGLTALSSKGDGTFLKHPGKSTAAGEVLIGNKPPPSFLCNMTLLSSEGSRAGNWIPGARIALLCKVREGPFHLNCKKLKNTWFVKKKTQNNRGLYAQMKYAVLLSSVNAVCKSRTVFFAPVDECVFIGSVLGCKICIPSYLPC